VHLPDRLDTGIWWYARFPNHYARDGAVAAKELGEYDTRTAINDLVAAIKAVKVDAETLKLQQESIKERLIRWAQNDRTNESP
jgi:creatinine amidohydrolase